MASRITGSPLSSHSRHSLLVYIVGSNIDQAALLNKSLLDNGYRVQIVNEADASFHAACTNADAEKPAVVVMDVAFSGDDIPAAILHDINLCKNAGVPVTVISDRDDLPARLAAFRAGARHYLTKPVDTARLIDTLDALSGRQAPEPYRILLVEDDPVSMELYSGMLRRAGMEVQALSEPLKTLEIVNSFRPDVIVLDLYLPGISGQELVAVLRDSGFQLPVLFLSGETDMSRQVLALNEGGDDFLVKPVQEERLIATVTSRARRSRRGNAVCSRLEKSLYEREREHLALNQHAIVSVADSKGNIIHANELFCQVSGYSLKELLGRNHRIIKSGLHPDGFYRDMWRTIASGQVWHGELCNRRKDGSLYWVESTITPFLDEDGKPYQYVSIRTDITHNKERERALQAIVDSTRMLSGEAFLLSVVQSLAESMDVRFAFIAEKDHDDDSMIRTVAIWDADHVLENFSYSVKGTPCEKVLETGLAVFAEKVADLFPEDDWLKVNGIESYVGIPLFDSSGDFLGHMGVVDIKPLRNADQKVDVLRIFAATVAGEIERRQAEMALVTSENRLNFLLTSSPVTIYTCAATSPFGATYISPNIKQLLGYEPEQFINDADFWAEQIHPEDRQQVFDNLPQLFKHGTHQHQYRFRKQDGSYIWMHDELRLIKNAAGEVIEMTGYWADHSEQKAAELALEINKERLRRGQVFANIGTWDWNVVTGELFWSERIGPLFGYAEGELETSYDNFLGAIHPDDRQSVIDAVGACVEYDEPYDIEHRVVWPDGTVRWLHERGAVVRDAEGRPQQMLGVVQDIHHRKQAELALVEREHQLREAQTMAHLGNWQADVLTGELEWSDEIYRIFGYEPGSVVPSVELFHSTVHPDDREKVLKSERVAEQTGRHDVTHRIVRPDGSVRYVHELAQAVTDSAGRLIQMTGTVQDVTEQVEAEATLAENEEKFRGLYEQSPVGITLNTMDGHFVEANQSYLDIIGYTAEECQSMTYWQLTPEEYASQEALQLESLHSSGRYGPYEKEYIHKDGHRVDVLLNGSIVHDRDGHKRIWSVVQDISKRKQADLALNRFKTTLDMTKDCVFMFEPVSLKFFYVNQGAIEQFGYSEAELLTMTPVDIKPYYDEAGFRQAIQPLIEGKTEALTLETVHQHKDGAEIPVEISLQYIEPEGESARFVAIVRNITERKQTEAAIIDSQQRMALHVQRTPLGVIEWDNHFCVTEWNNSAESIFGYTREEALGRHAADLVLSENVFEDVGDVWEQLLTLKGGLRSSNENVTKSGKLIFCEWYNTPLIDTTGKVIGVASLVQDVTKQKSAEIALIKAKVEAEYANAAKSEFLSSMSHELRTPMNSILGFSQLLKYDEELSDEQQDNVQEILRAGHHLLNLINEVLDLAKVESGQIDLSLEPVEVCRVAEECMSLVATLAAKRDIQLSCSGLRNAIVRADRTRIKQVLINLLSNAIKYNRDGGSVELEIVQQDQDSLRIIVKDTGIGIAKDRLSELFQPFNRLDAEETDIEGTGIGLTITRRIIEMMGGSVGVHSTPGVGSEFWVELPLESLSGSNDGEASGQAEQQVQKGTEIEHTILYIEDNPANLKLVAQILGHRRHLQLLTAHTPEIGLELITRRNPDLILLDINMPGMDGYEVLEILKADKELKHIPVVAVTANAMLRDIDRGKAAGFTDYVTKPIEVAKFLDIVDQCLTIERLN